MSKHQAVIDYIESFGLDPDLIDNDTHSATYYREFQLDYLGNKVLSGGNAATLPRAWPAGFDYEHFCDLMVEAGRL